MKLEARACLLQERLNERGLKVEELAGKLFYKPEKLYDYISMTRIMPLQVAVSIADTLGCEVRSLYEWVPVEGIPGKEGS
ncbi:helix-turn-helix domain-containing protein [Paenibacillus mucilaginosus]|uniref:Helix-turn-helix domain-containing protein n=3 Tax=Paenibacillus mucilaginosus TaxID=61624 RepID=H6NKB8_9BACL|nr:helix-turn-helix transcriptional regulator [Paenibacillus mucilaginosus]AEI44021.1 helix-turn-helix domain protein [Paenibacillus mucilaginosus KNP414]AFC31602.1 helix-turn-helix domain-containing protein [Paenibacillus mucilaginosus 3016]AFH63950.1 transcriptional regulator [Paenibacillus mucilaginosus K02]MCG7212491.1 helix-turn-helix transcriptional regulator [Paenibacillus mucilaginosus]WDM25474.1 helix-turn-helix transcriptional regulator [Paenibacillus mucilaginosus]